MTQQNIKAKNLCIVNAIVFNDGAMHHYILSYSHLMISKHVHEKSLTQSIDRSCNCEVDGKYFIET